MKKNPGAVFILVLLLFILTDAYSSTAGLSSVTDVTDTTATGREIVISGVGDIMLGTSFPSVSYLPSHDDPSLFLVDISDSLSASDITFGNLEGSFSDDAEAAKKCRDTSVCYLFRMPERYIGALTSSGFDMLSLANNHFGDFGPSARLRTMEILDSVGIIYAGIEECPWSICKKDSVLYGFCAFAPNEGAMDINDYLAAGDIVSMLADTCDIVIVSFHGGAEGADYQNIPKENEIYYGEKRGDVYRFAHSVIDKGADVVFGHGPHVTRAVEVYRERFISYSLGNFCTYGRFNLNGPNGIAPLIKISVDISGRFIHGRIVPLCQNWSGKVEIDTEGKVISKIQELMASDIPDAVITVSDDGGMFYK